MLKKVSVWSLGYCVINDNEITSDIQRKVFFEVMT